VLASVWLNRRVVVAPGSCSQQKPGFSFSHHCISSKYSIKVGSRLDVDISRTYTKDMSTKKRRGRPPKGSGATKSESLLLRLEPREKVAFRDAANLAGVPLTVWMRERLRRVAARELQDGGKSVAFLG
jgi:hypothetical protein